MKKILILLIFIIFSCTSYKPAMSINTAAYDSAFLRASYLASHGKTSEALVILKFINNEISDEYVVLKISDIHLARGESGKAIEVLQSATETSALKNSDKLYYQKAKLYYLSKNYDEGIKSINTAILINEEQAYFKLLATFHLQKKDYAAAIKAYDKLIENEELSDFYFQRGRAYLNLGLVKNAVKDFEKATDIDNHTKALLSLSEIFIKKREYSKAIAYLEKISDSKNIDMLVKYKLGQLYLEEKRPDEAILLYEGIKQDIGGKEKQYLIKQLAKLYFEQKNYEQAQKYFIEAVDVNPGDIQAIYFAGITSEALKQNETAVKYYEKALDIRSDYGQVLKRLSFLKFQEKEFPAALKYLNTIDELDRDVEFYRLKAVIHAEQKDIEKQRKTLEDGIRKYKDNEELLLAHSFLLESNKEYDKAIEILEHLIEINPANASALNFLGYMYAELNIKLDYSYSLIKEALKLDSKNPAYQDSMAWVLYRKGDFKKAYKYQLKSLRQLPEEQEIVDHMKAILESLGSKKTIEEVLKEK